MPTLEQEWPRADSEIAAGAFVGASGRKTRMSAFDPKRTSGRASICLAAQYFDIKRGLLWKGDYAPGCGFLLHGFALLILQFSLVEAHARIVIE